MANIKMGQSYDHINSALPDWDTPTGRHVRNKDHYDRIMKENGLEPYDESKKKTDLKPYVLSEKAQRLLHIIKRDKKDGKIKLTEEIINRMKEIGAIKEGKQPAYMLVP